MKNIHVLPTDKPSRLWINNLLQGKLELSKELLIGSNTAQQIYITSNNFNKISDEGVHHNSGDWLLDTINNKIFQAFINIISEDDIQKIILTTDQDLIKDGVQAIDIEFLEWFVKNPSCEVVEVTQLCKIGCEKLILNGINSICCGDKEYKIIIPKEEPKKNWYCAKCESYVSSENVTFEDQICNTGVIIEKTKQETLEEVADRLTKDFPHYSVRDSMDDTDIKGWLLESLQKGAEWQQEQILDFLYSEITERRDYSASKMSLELLQRLQLFLYQDFWKK
jgi:hypothetical protein